MADNNRDKYYRQTRQSINLRPSKVVSDELEQNRKDNEREAAARQKAVVQFKVGDRVSTPQGDGEIKAIKKQFGTAYVKLDTRTATLSFSVTVLSKL